MTYYFLKIKIQKTEFFFFFFFGLRKRVFQLVTSAKRMAAIGSFTLTGSIAESIRLQNLIEEYGFLGEGLVEEVFQVMDADQAFEVPDRIIERTQREKDQRSHLLQPKAYAEKKLPSMTDFMESGSKFEKPLFDQSLKLRKILFPVTALCCLMNREELSADEFSLMGAIAHSLKQEVVDELRNLHLKRLAAKIPDKEARNIILAEKDSVLQSQAVSDILTHAKTIKKTQAAFKPARGAAAFNQFKKSTAPQRKKPSSSSQPPRDESNSTPSSSSSSSSSTNPPLQAPSAVARGGHGGKPRGK